MDSLHQRLQNAYGYLLDRGIVHSQTQFAEAIGKRVQQVNDAFQDRPKRCTLGLMTAIANAFPDVLKRDYLLTGEGEVAAPDKSMRPHYDAKAAAGFMLGLSEAETGTLRPHIPGMRDYDFTIRAEGDSMMPRIESGDLLVCRKSEGRANPPIGKICVIDGKDGVVVKVIAEANEYGLVLRSLNPDPKYRDYPVDHSVINGIAEVVGLVRSF